MQMDRIHLKSPKNWINDPNGFIYYKGQYHLFYQYFPYGLQWGRMHWGHAVSNDLVNWEHLDIALYPSKTDDRSGCFSGSAVEYNERLYLFYTGVNYTVENPENINCMIGDGFISSQLMITSYDGITFDNLADKKTIISPISDNSIGSEVNTRDPKVWRGKDAWYMILGSTIENTGRFLFYKSSDLEKWEYVNFCEKSGIGWMWECPDYFEVDNRGIVIFSPIGILDDGLMYDSAAVCCLADFDEKSCTMKLADEYQIFDYGIDLYAPQSTVDANGKRVVIAWARMPKAVDDKWIGMMSIPRVVEVKDEHIYFRPHPNVRNIFSTITDKPSHDKEYMLRTILKNGEEINIGGYVIKRENDRIITDRTAVFPQDSNYRYTAETPVIRDGYSLEIYVDSNLIEVFVNDGEYVISSVVYGLSDKITGKNFTVYSAE